MAKKEVLFCDMCKEQIELDLIEMPDPDNLSNFVTIGTVGNYHLFGLDVCLSCKRILGNLIKLFPHLTDCLNAENSAKKEPIEDWAHKVAEMMGK